MFGPIVTLAQIDEAVKMVDKASTASDRWLFLAALVIILFGCGIAIRFLVRALAQAQIKSDASLDKQQVKYDELTTKIYGEHAKLTAEVIVALKDNTEIIAETRDILKRFDVRQDHRA